MWFWLAAVFLLPSGDSAPVDRASEVRCRDIALTRGPYRLSSRSPDGEAVEQWVAFNSIWRKDDAGKWRVVFDAGSPTAAPLPEAQVALLDLPDDCPAAGQPRSTTAPAPGSENAVRAPAQQ